MDAVMLGFARALRPKSSGLGLGLEGPRLALCIMT